MLKNFKLIAEILDEKPSDIKKIKTISDINNFKWDSLAFINLITIYNSKFKKTINIKNIKKIKTLNQLDDLLK